MSRQPIYTLVRVTGVERITPHMARVTLTAEPLAHLASVAPDQQIKLFFPLDSQSAPVMADMPEDGDVSRWYQNYLAMPEDQRPWMRAYTIRHHRPEAAAIDVDFVLHGDEGPASAWVGRAQAGDVLGFYGPAEGRRNPGPDAPRDWWLLAGDETALPAIGAMVESFPPGSRALVFAEVADKQEEQPLLGPGRVEVHWVHRDGAERGRLLIEAVRSAELPPGSLFAWLAGEAGMVRTLRRHLVNDRAMAKADIAFTGYWRARLTQDAPPTEQDIADSEDQTQA